MKNILLFICDSLRADYLTPEITPNLWRLKEDWWSYDQCISGNSCTELSLPVMISGSRKYDPSDSIMADLKELGFSSTLLHSNPKVHRFREGWDEVIDFHKETAKQKKKIRRLLRKYTTKAILDRVTEFANLEDQKDYLPYTRAFEKLDYLEDNEPTSPSFQWVHLMDPHLPYYPIGSKLSHKDLMYINSKHVDAVHKRIEPGPDEVITWLRLYEAEITEMEQYMGEYLKKVDFDKTTVLITSDHGEEFGEHGEYSHPGDKFVPELVHVPLIILGEVNGSIDKMFSHYSLRKLIRRIAKDGFEG